MTAVCDNECEADRCVNTNRPLTRSLDYGEEGLAMQATRICSIQGCDARHYAKGWCRNHYMRWWSTGIVPTRPGRPTGPEHHLWTGSEASYSTAHKRLVGRRGRASLNACGHCGGPAREWAYDHKDPNELIERMNGRPVAYSPDPAHYLPLCKSCHARFDRKVT